MKFFVAPNRFLVASVFLCFFVLILLLKFAPFASFNVGFSFLICFFVTRVRWRDTSSDLLQSCSSISFGKRKQLFIIITWSCTNNLPIYIDFKGSEFNYREYFNFRNSFSKCIAHVNCLVVYHFCFHDKILAINFLVHLFVLKYFVSSISKMTNRK